MVEVKTTVENAEENRKTEKVTKIENKLSIAEQNREKELQKKLEIAKKYVCITIYIFSFFICNVINKHCLLHQLHD